MHLKKLRIGPYELCMLALVTLATLLRFLLIYFKWPTTNSDEGTIDLMALHIAYRGEHPIFYYGQYYMGPLEAYIGALLFHLLSSSVFAVRLGLVVFYTCFLVCMYFLTSRLYSKGLALLTVGLLSAGSLDMLLHQLRAIGGYPEITLLGALILLLTAHLTLTSQQYTQQVTRKQRLQRLLTYAFMGFMLGFALWDDPLILPILAVAGGLLLIFCYRELLALRGFSLLAGLLIGAFPLLRYNLSAPSSNSTLHELLMIHHAGADLMLAQHIPVMRQFIGAFMIALPTITGVNPLCAQANFPFFGPQTAQMFSCMALQGGWATGYLILWLSAVLLATSALKKYLWHYWQYRQQSMTEAPSFEERQACILHCNRLMLLASAALAFLSYTLSPSAALEPALSSRYLICIQLVTPAVLWPLWCGINRFQWPLTKRDAVGFVLKISVVIYIATMLLAGTIRTLIDIPNAQASYRQQDALVQKLLTIGATHIYSDYWTCNRLTFYSNERIICSVVDGDLVPWQNRYKPYQYIVGGDPYAAYVLPMTSEQAINFEQKVQLQQKKRFLRSLFENYLIYQTATYGATP